MNKRLAYLNVRDYNELLEAYFKHGIKFGNCLDGGAGSGSTAMKMLPYMKEDGTVFAFEPFPGNHHFFDKISDNRIKLIKKALYSEKSVQKLYVRATVAEDSSWGKKGMVGYSSLGFIDKAPETRDQSKLHTIECAAADEEISPDYKIDFVKLDLQGGEPDALKGMKRILFEPYFLWVEFTDQPGLLDHLYDLGFVIFETAYLIMGESPEKASDDFTFLYKAGLSTGASAWFGQRIRPWGDDFHDEFQNARKQYGLVQTDLVCIHASKFAQFNKVLKVE